MSTYLKVLRTWSIAGRASRAELWTFFLISVIVSALLHLVDRATGLTWGSHRGGFLASFYALVVFFPGLGVQVRRLHDIGKPGLFLFAAFIPVVGALLLLYWYLQDGSPGDNPYGPAPSQA